MFSCIEVQQFLHYTQMNKRRIVGLDLPLLDFNIFWPNVSAFQDDKSRAISLFLWQPLRRHFEAQIYLRSQKGLCMSMFQGSGFPKNSRCITFVDCLSCRTVVLLRILVGLPLKLTQEDIVFLPLLNKLLIRLQKREKILPTKQIINIHSVQLRKAYISLSYIYENYPVISQTYSVSLELFIAL